MGSYKMTCKAPHIPKFDAEFKPSYQPHQKISPRTHSVSSKAIMEVMAKKTVDACRASNPVVKFLASLVIELSWLLKERET